MTNAERIVQKLVFGGWNDFIRSFTGFAEALQKDEACVLQILEYLEESSEDGFVKTRVRDLHKIMVYAFESLVTLENIWMTHINNYLQKFVSR